MIGRSRAGTVLGIVVLAFMSPLRAGAEPAAATPAPTTAASEIATDAEAKRLFDEAQRHFRAGENDEAIAALQQAYDRTREPALLFDLGQVYRRKGDCASALGFYQQFLASHPSDVDRRRAEAHVDNVTACAATPPDSSDETTLSPAAPDKISNPLAVAEVVQRVDVSAMAASAPARPSNTGRIAGIALAGAGVALGATGFILRGVATTKIDSMERAANGSPPQPYDEKNGNWRTFEIAGVSMIVVGSTALVGGGVLYLMNLAPREEPKVAISINPSMSQPGITLTGRY